MDFEEICKFKLFEILGEPTRAHAPGFDVEIMNTDDGWLRFIRCN